VTSEQPAELAMVLQGWTRKIAALADPSVVGSPLFQKLGLQYEDLLLDSIDDYILHSDDVSTAHYSVVLVHLCSICSVVLRPFMLYLLSYWSLGVSLPQTALLQSVILCYYYLSSGSPGYHLTRSTGNTTVHTCSMPGY